MSESKAEATVKNVEALLTVAYSNYSQDGEDFGRFLADLSTVLKAGRA